MNHWKNFMKINQNNKKHSKESANSLVASQRDVAEYSASVGTLTKHKTHLKGNFDLICWISASLFSFSFLNAFLNFLNRNKKLL